VAVPREPDRGSADGKAQKPVAEEASLERQGSDQGADAEGDHTDRDVGADDVAERTRQYRSDRCR